MSNVIWDTFSSSWIDDENKLLLIISKRIPKSSILESLNEVSQYFKKLFKFSTSNEFFCLSALEYRLNDEIIFNIKLESESLEDFNSKSDAKEEYK